MTAKKSALVLPFRPLAAAEPTHKRSGLFSVSASRWVGKEPAPTKWVVDQLIPEGSTTLLVGAGGRGKSFLALQMMTCVAAGAPFLGFEVSRGVAAGLFAEDDEDELHKRAKAICAKLELEFADGVAPFLFPISAVGHATILWDARKGRTEFLTAIENDIAQQADAKLWVIDGAAFTFAAKR